jgi:succinate dehydrogenase/fumarate reductase flavoprotein subunit
VTGGGHVAFEGLLAQVKKIGIQVLYNTQGHQLIQNGSGGAVLGVIAKNNDKTLSIRARKAVILTCGGYENNPQMQGNFNFPGLRFYPWGSPYNTGDGLWMASAAGARLWHMTSLEWASFGIKAVSEEIGAAAPFAYAPPMSGSYMFVNKHGNRFMDETLHLSHYKGPLASVFFDHENAEYPNVPFYLVFDETFRKQGPLVPPNYWPGQKVGWLKVQNLLEGWSKDNSKEIEKGWIIKADSLEQLASKVGIDEKNLSTTASDFGRSAGAGRDSAYKRPAKTLAPLSTPPFYAAELCFCTINTQGGPVHNAKAQVLDVNNNIIPRLYAAGELGSIFGHLYQGASNFPEAIGMGRVAGKNAAAEKPWRT